MNNLNENNKNNKFKEDNQFKQDRIALIRERLMQAFSPTQLDIIDESDAHRGHAGYQGGARHFAIIIDAACLKSGSRIETHRLIYAALDEMIPEQIHALRIKVI